MELRGDIRGRQRKNLARLVILIGRAHDRPGRSRRNQANPEGREPLPGQVLHLLGGHRPL